jgi:hypothetical protein
MAARPEPQTLALIRLGGWRPAATLTLVKEALAARFTGFRGFPPVARNLPKIGTCTLHRPSGKRHGCLSAAQIQLLQDLNDRQRLAQAPAEKDPMRSNSKLQKSISHR